MKQFINLSFTVLAVLFTVIISPDAIAQSNEGVKEVVSNSNMSMKIDGMTCAMGCARAIEVELNKLEGVEDAKVNFESADAVLAYNASVISKSAIVDFVNNYRNGAFKASCDSDKKSCSEEQKSKCASSAKLKTCCAKTKTKK